MVFFICTIFRAIHQTSLTYPNTPIWPFLINEALGANNYSLEVANFATIITLPKIFSLLNYHKV